MTKFNVGDTVIYHRVKAAKSVGLSEDVKATVVGVAVDYNGIKYTQSLYHIQWNPTGKATVHESELSKAE